MTHEAIDLLGDLPVDSSRELLEVIGKIDSYAQRYLDDSAP